MSLREDNKQVMQDAVNGIYRGIPWRAKKITKYLGGVKPKTYTVILAFSNVGKTRIALFLYWWEPINYSYSGQLRKPGEVEVIVNSLEVPKDKLLAMMLANYAGTFEDYNFSDKQVLGIEEDVHPDALKVSYSEAYQKYLDRIDKHTHLESIHDVDKFIDYITKILLENSVEIGKDKSGKILYRLKNPKKIFIIIVDHIGNMTLKNSTTFDAITKMSKAFIEFRNDFGVSIVVLQQANTNNEKKWLPDQNDVRAGKETFIDADEVFSIGNPYIAGVPKVDHGTGKDRGTYYILPTKASQGVGLLNTIRFITSQKVRYGDLVLRLPIKFNGAISSVEDMPPPNEVEY